MRATSASVVIVHQCREGFSRRIISMEISRMMLGGICWRYVRFVTFKFKPWLIQTSHGCLNIPLGSSRTSLDFMRQNMRASKSRWKRRCKDRTSCWLTKGERDGEGHSTAVDERTVSSKLRDAELRRHAGLNVTCLNLQRLASSASTKSKSAVAISPQIERNMTGPTIGQPTPTLTHTNIRS